MSFLGINSEAWGIIGAVIGLLLLVGSLIVFIIKGIFSIGKFSQRLKSVEKTMDSIKIDINSTHKDLTTRIDNLMNISIQKGLSVANSPRKLSDEGKKVLKDSGADQIVNDKFDIIAQKTKKSNPENAYQAEKDIFEIVKKLIKDPVINDAMENGAFQSGYPLEAVLFVAGLYIRDRVLKELGFKLSEIDEHNPKNLNI